MFESETFPTDFASELSDVELFVLLEAGALSEPPAADVAPKHLCAAVSQGVRLEVAGVVELLPAVTAAVRFVFSVDNRVPFEAACRGEGFAAFVAGRPLSTFLSGVDPLVVLQRAGVPATFAAGLADVIFLSGVFKHVVFQGALVAQLFPTDRATKEFLSAMVNCVVVGVFFL